MKKLIRAVVVDDEKYSLELFKIIAESISDIQICASFENYLEAMEYIQSNRVDVVFLDIEMPEVNGLELSQRILNIKPEANIVFVTAFNKYAVEAFEINAVDYLMKPFTVDRLKKTVQRLKDRKSTKNNSYDNDIYFKCFGSFNIYKNGESIICKNSKAREILAYLLHNEGVPVGWEKIVDAIWPEHDYEKAHANFHSTFYLLRKFLSENNIAHIIEYSRGSYRVQKDKIHCDMYEFKKLLHNYRGKKLDKELYNSIELLFTGGYFEENGYSWAYAKAAELEMNHNKLIDKYVF